MCPMSASVQFSSTPTGLRRVKHLPRQFDIFHSEDQAGCILKIDHMLYFKHLTYFKHMFYICEIHIPFFDNRAQITSTCGCK